VKHFDDVKGVASFLGVHLGVNEAPACTTKEQTRVEKFNYVREMHTPAWHARRHRLAQTFLDRFVRQNVAEIDEIPYLEQNVKVQLPPAERAIYLELEHHLQAMEMKTVKTVKRGAKGSKLGDKEGRLREVRGACVRGDSLLGVMKGIRGASTLENVRQSLKVVPFHAALSGTEGIVATSALRSLRSARAG
jgi:hypothetical protein